MRCSQAVHSRPPRLSRCVPTPTRSRILALPTLIAAQSSVDWDERGVVTGANLFARSMGSALGVAVFGALANSYFGEGDVHTLGAAAIQSGTAAVFVGVVVVAVLATAAVVAMPQTPPHDVAP